jgi:acetyl esterase/lipase
MTKSETMTNDRTSGRPLRHSGFVIPSGFVLRVSSFTAALALFLCSLLVVYSAPTASLWIVAILIAEWGHYFAIASLILAVLSWRRDALGVGTASLGILAALLCIWPAVQAKFVASDLPERCTDAFGVAPNESGRVTPFRIVDLFRGVPVSGVDVSEHVYATEGKKQLKLDLYRSRQTTGAPPLIITIHGGSWNGGGKQQLPALNRYLAHEGYTVAAINYRHAPQWPFPAAVEDVFRAIEFLKAHAAEFQFDATRIILIGRSAGGQLALSAAYAGKEPNIRGVVSLYGPTDLVLGYEHPSRRGVIDSKRVLEDYLGGPPAQKPAEYAAGSAVNFVNAATPPTLLVHGQLDPIVWPEQGERLAARLREAGRPHLYLSIPWGTHGCDANINGPSGQLSLYAIDRFLAAVFTRSGGF